MAQFAGRDDVFDGLRFFDDLGREAVGQMKFADHDFDVDAEIVLLRPGFR
jgi:hypothetical protein